MVDIKADHVTGSVYIDMSTIDPATTQRVGKAFAEKGVDMIDSPVGKTVDRNGNAMTVKYKGTVEPYPR